MKILITGAGGMLGRALVQALSPYFEVEGIGLKVSPSFLPAYTTLDLRDRQATQKFFSRKKFDIIFHTAAMTDVDRCETERERAYDANVQATENLAFAVKEQQAFLIFFSTDYIFDGREDVEYDEKAAANPLNYYGQTKLLAEMKIKELCRRYIIFRISWLFAPYGHCFPRTLLKRAPAQQVFRVVSDQVGRPTYALDLAESLCCFLQAGGWEQWNQEVFHLANHGFCSWFEFASSIFSEAKLTNRVETMTTQELNRPAERPAHAVLSLAKAEKQLGIKLPHWKHALQHFVKNYKESE